METIDYRELKELRDEIWLEYANCKIPFLDERFSGVWADKLRRRVSILDRVLENKDKI
jgi:hypothetical protein